MSNVQIPNLPASVALNGNEQLEAVQGGTSVRVTTDQIATYTQAQYPAPGVSSIATTAPITGGTITSTGTIGLQAAGVDNSYLASMAGGTVKANVTGSPAQPSDASVSSVLDVVGSTRGTVLYRGVSSWSPLLPGSANNILSSGGAGADPTWQSISATLDTTAGSSQGSLLYRNASTWTALPPGTSGQILQTNGGGANPSWATVSGAGTVTQVNTGTGLTGGPITISGTVSIANTGVAAASYGTSSAVPTVTVNAQGQITSATDTAIAIATSQITSGTLGIDRGGTGLSSVPTNGQIDIGNGTGFTRTTLTASTGISISNGAGSISITNSGVLSFSAGTTGLTPSTGTTGAVTLAGTLNVANGGTGATSLTGYVYGNGTGAFTASTTIPNSGLQNSSLTIGSTAISLGNTASSIAGLTSLTLTQDPINPLDAATKQYVDSTIEGLNIHAPAAAATTANLTATYNNGTSGVGATLTNSGAQAAFAVDGYTAALNDRILVKNQSTAAQNGVYTVTTVGSGSTNWVLTRATDMNTSGSGADQLGPGDYVFVVNGTQNAGTAWVVTTPLPITIGSTSITFVQFAGAGTYTAGTGLTLTGTQFSITNTGVSAASYGSASSVPAITVNAQGQITSAANTSIAIAASQITSGTLEVTRGGTGTSTAFTAGSLVFAGASGIYSQDNANLFWDDSNNYLGIGTATPAAPLNVSVSTSGDAVRITQTGAGNALVVEDSANPDATPFVIDASGNVGIGTSSPSTYNGKLNVKTSDQAVIGYFGGTTYATRLGSNASFAVIEGVDAATGVSSYQPLQIGGSLLKFDTGGTERMRIDSSGNVGIGTSSPLSATNYKFVTVQGGSSGGGYSLYNSSGAEAGRFQADPNQVALYNWTASLPTTFYTNSTERLRIDSSGNVGIGTSSPSDKFQVNSQDGVRLGASGSTSYARIGSALTGESTAQISYDRAAGSTIFSQGNTGSALSERMRIDSSGNVGIGTSSPGNKLDIVSAGSSQIRVKDGVNATAYYDFGRDGTDGFFGFSGAQTTFSGYKWSVNAGSEVMRITNGGNVGIGTSSPGERLVVQGSTGNVIAQIRNSSTVASTSKTTAVQFIGTDTVGTAKETGDIYITPADNNYVGSNMQFYTRGSDAVAERLRIGPAGQLGIGGANYGTSGQVLTSNGSAAAPSWQTAGGGFAAGTAMMFVQTAAPTGWTKSTTHDNKALRVVSGAASSGGSVAFTTAFASQTPAGTVGSTTLSTAQIPSHTHTYEGNVGGGCSYSGGGSSFANRTSGATGGGGSHNHSFTGTAINLAVQYVDVIIATKD